MGWDDRFDEGASTGPNSQDVYNPPSLEAPKILQALIEAETGAKVIVVESTTALVEGLASSWRKHFKLIWLHGKLSNLETMSQTGMFFTDVETRVLGATKLVTEGVDIRVEIGVCDGQ
ncbi:uncharacterized protein ZBAI_09904 [Zygosaccharomyces bailii ISA1307]|nr:uncharacterized protein ZBAI_09904 [Zygosaccharomyces bailii ISA1307]